MAALRRAAAIALLVAGGPAEADAVARWQPIIAEASQRFGLPAVWIERVIRAESAGLTAMNGRPIRSRAGAMGLMQLMPATWASMRRQLALPDDPDDPRANILAGSLFLRLMHDRFGYPGLFAAYNMGPAGYARYLAGTRTMPGETVAYLAKLSGGVPRPSPIAGTSPALLFVVRRGSATAPSEPAAAGLFVVLARAR